MEREISITRRNSALNTALADNDLFEKMHELGVSRVKVLAILKELNEINQRAVACSEMRNLIRKRLSKNKPANKLAQNYRRNMAAWVEGTGGYDYCPTLKLQNLPELTNQSLHQYLALFGEICSDKSVQDCLSKIVAALGGGGPLNEANAWANSIRMQDSPELLERFHDEFDSKVGILPKLIYQQKNLETKLIDYAEGNQRASMTLLMYILRVCNENTDLVVGFESLLRASLRTLTQNNHFTRSLFHLIDRSLAGKSVPNRLNHRLIRSIVTALYQIGVCTPYRFVDEKDKIDQPRDASTFEFRFYDLDPDNEFKYVDATLSAPIENVPTHWNGHRIVDPTKSPTFKRFSKAINTTDLEAFLSGVEDKLQNYIEGMRSERRYALEFSRLNVTEMPGLEDFDIWFHYFRDEGMPSGQIGLEMIVDGASVVYFLNSNGELIMKNAGNLIPSRPGYDASKTQSLDPNPTHFPLTRAVWQAAKQGRKPIGALLEAWSGPKSWDHFQRGDFESIDHLYGDTRIRKWTSPEALKFLRFYFIKYAYYLLVQPRTAGNSQSNSGANNREEDFGLCLSEYQSEVTIPNHPGFAKNGDSESRIIIFHGVTGHIRQLPSGKNASQGAVEAAEEHGIVLLPGQTFVKPHTRGGVVSGQYTSEKKVNSD